MDAGSLAAEADRAFAAGDRPRALQLQQQLILVAPDFANWMKLGAMRRAEGQLEAALQAINAALAIAPLDFMALLSRASVLERLGSSGAGEAYHQALAQKPGGALPQQLQSTVSHAEASAAKFVAAKSASLRSAAETAMARATDAERKRIDRFISNAVHETRPYHSEPTHFHYPGLAEHEFHDPAHFPWLSTLEDATGDIVKEFDALIQSDHAELVPYIRYAEHQPIGQFQDLNHSRDWTAIHLWDDGKVVEANASRCPRTMALLDRIPQPRVAGVSPSAMFSLLAPNTHIPPHTGLSNTRLVCHLPLIVPDGCWFRVGAETRAWEVGKAFVFDDTIEHEAMNPSGQLRVVLIIDVWHPGLNEGERDAVRLMMEAGNGAAPRL